MGRRRWTRWTAEDIAQLRQLAADGYTRKRAADKMGRPHGSYIGNVANRNGFQFMDRGHGRPIRVDWNHAKQLAEQGYFASKAARKLGVHHTTMLYIARKLGFKWPAPPVVYYPRHDCIKAPRSKVAIVIPAMPNEPLDPRAKRMMELMAIIARKPPVSVAPREMGVRSGRA